METSNISFDEDNSSLPDLPNLSQGSSVSSAMENEYNDLIQNTIIVPQLNILEDVNIPKILDNKLGLFSTKIINEDIQLVSLNKEIKQNDDEIKVSEQNLQTKLSEEMDQFLLNNSSNNNNNNNEEYPRQNSPVPASPPTNLDFDINETSSLDTILHNIQTKSNYTNNNSSLFNLTGQENLSTINNNKPLDLNNNHMASNNNKNVKIASCLDKWYKELKGHVLSEFEKSRLLMLQEQQKKLIEEKEKQTVEIVKLKKELDMVREQVKVYERKTLKKETIIENMTKAFEKQCEKTELQRVMMEWKLKRVESAREEFTQKVAEKHYNIRLKMKTFLCWHQFLVSRRRVKLEKACKKKAEEVCYDLATKYEGKIKKLEDELNKNKKEIENYKVEMAKNEENMRKALMRGVCALNMEAMSIFNETVSNKNIHNNIVNNENHEEQEHFNNELKKQYNNQLINEELLDNNHERFKQQHSAQILNETESQELAKRVRNYCQVNLNNRNSLIKSATNNNKATASNQSNYLTINPNVVSHTKLINSCNKVFDELNEHNIVPTTHNNKQNKQAVKSKIGSLTTNGLTPSPMVLKNPISKSINSNLPPQIPVYRSFLIEKHSNINNTSTNTTASRVKYAPPGQPATCLNTVINAGAQ